VTATDLAPTDAAPSVAGPRHDPSAWRRGGAWLRVHPGLVVVMIIPLVVFSAALPFGRVFVDGDNFTQNFPLRVLVGQDLQHGLAPYWNPYLFSGTPLLGGFNAGAAYPMTWLTAVLPIFTAWTIGLIVAYEVAIVGMFAFMRRLGVRSAAATMSAATFAGAGYMSGQLIHIDLITGAAWLPWMLLAVHELTEPAPTDPGGLRLGQHRLRWAAVFAGTFGLSILAGGAEDVIDSAVLIGIYWIGRLVVTGHFQRANRRHLVASVGALAVGAAGGLVVGAAQWLPGLAFAATSQRSTANYQFFTSGTLTLRVVPLLFSPFALGSNQTHPFFYAGPYNFPEVTSYMGILALIATCSLFVRRWRQRPEARHWWIWYVIIVVGLLSALGGQTPFAHLMYLIPGINDERLLNRNLLLVDFSMAVLLGWWLHLLLEERAPAGPGYVPVRRRWQPGRRSELVVTCAPAALIVILCLFLWIDPSGLEKVLGFTGRPATSNNFHRIAALVTVGAVIAVAATWVVLIQARLPIPRLRRLLVAVLAVDLVFFGAFVLQPPLTQAQAQARTPQAATFKSLVGNGRFIIYDPDEFYTNELYKIGQTDLNMYSGIASAQGYTALTDGNYYNATGAHLLESLNPATLPGPVWDGLNVTTLLSIPSYFVTPVAGTTTVHTASVIPPPAGPVKDLPPVPTSFRLAPGHSHRWLLGGKLSLDGLSIPDPGGAADGLRVGIVTAGGPVDWLGAHTLHTEGTGAGRTLEATLATPVDATGLVVQSTGPTTAVVKVPIVSTPEAGQVALDGPLQSLVTAPHWVFTGTLGSFGVFHNTRAKGWGWLSGPDGGSAPAGSSLEVAEPGLAGGQAITVHATSAVELQRSVSWTTGWHASIQTAEPGGGGALGPPAPIGVHQDGIIQEVTLPRAGTYVVTFRYEPKTARVGWVVSAIGAVALVVWVAVEMASYRRRRRRLRPDPPPGITPG
jgi:hypothetical protein